MARLWILLLLAVSCDQAGIARVTFLLPKELPDRTLYATVRVEERSDRIVVLAGEAPIELLPGADQLQFAPLSIPHGDDRVVIAELSESPDRDVVWYGFSAPFSLRAGDDIEIPVALTEQPPLDNHVAISTITPGFVRTSTVELELTTDRGVRALISNSQNFPDPPIDLSGGPVPWTLDGAPCDRDDGCALTVFVRFIDAQGYGSHTISAPIVLDSTLPRLSGRSEVRLIPLGSALLQEVTRAQPGTEVQVSFTLSEPVSAPPVLVARFTDEVIPFGRCDGSSLTWLCTLTFPGSEEPSERTYSIEAQAIDRAGNVARGLLVNTFVGDSVDPAPPNTDCSDCIVYRRVPFAAEPSYTVTGSAGAVADGDIVVMFESNDSAAREIGRSFPAGRDGSFSPVELTSTVVAYVYASTIDAAGNQSERRLIRNGVSVASFNLSVINPSHVRLEPHFETFARDPPDGAFREAINGERFISRGGYTWREVTLTSTAPSPRENQTMVWDPVRDRAVLFGGFEPERGLLDEHWEWDGFNWTLLERGPSHPPARTDHALVADVARSQVLLFGGRGAKGQLGDTWILKDGRWSDARAKGPGPRWGHSMVYDPIRGAVVLVGGLGPPPEAEALNDTWIWDGEWHATESATPPSRGFNRSATFDYARGVVVLFGGGRFLNDHDDDVWEWDGTDWRHIVPPVRPPARRDAMLVFHPELGAVLMFGGKFVDIAADVSLFGDAWTWDGAVWSSTSVDLTARADGSMFLDPARGRVYAFGGDPSVSSDADLSRIHADGSVESLARAADPIPRAHAAITADPITGDPLLVGGAANLSGSDGWTNDAWRFQRSRWVPVAVGSGPTPPPLAWPRMTTDPVAHSAILVGNDLSTSESRTWLFDGMTWSEIADDPRPHLEGTALAYDPLLSSVFSSGGRLTDGTATIEQWQLDGSTWTAHPSAAPNATAFHGLAADPNRQRVLFFGGEAGGSWYGDLFSWNGAWSAMQASLQPRSDHGLAFDTARDRLLVFGGRDAFGALSQLASWDPATNTWRGEITPSVELAPGPREGAAMQYDANLQSTLLFGGCPAAGCGVASLTRDTWLLERGAGTRPAIVLVADLRSSKAKRMGVHKIVVEGDFPNADLFVWQVELGRWVDATTPLEPTEWIDGDLRVHLAIVGQGDEVEIENAEVTIEYRLE